MKNEIVTCRDWNEKTHDIPTQDVRFRISTFGIVILNDSLLVCPQRDGYDLPGGGIEPYEDHQCALRREIEEETGLVIEPGQIVHADQEFYFSIPSRKAYNNTLLYYLCHNPRGKIHTKGFDAFEKTYARKAEWMPLSNIRNVKFHNTVDTLTVIQKAIKMIDS